MTNREATAIERLRTAQAAYAAIREQSKRVFINQGDGFDNATTAAYNELQDALWPFYTGKYQMPSDIGCGINA